MCVAARVWKHESAPDCVRLAAYSSPWDESKLERGWAVRRGHQVLIQACYDHMAEQVVRAVGSASMAECRGEGAGPCGVLPSKMLALAVSLPEGVLVFSSSIQEYLGSINLQY